MQCERVGTFLCVRLVQTRTVPYDMFCVYILFRTEVYGTAHSEWTLIAV